MRNSTEQKQNKNLVIVVLSIAVLFLMGLFLRPFLFPPGEESIPLTQQRPQGENPFRTVLLYEDLSKSTFTDAEQNPVALNDRLDQVQVLVYWASWCSYCQKDMENIDELAQKVAGEQGRLVLINKLDGKKETRGQALEYLKKNSVQTENLFDEGASQYEKYGLNMVPTVLVVDTKGRLVSFSEGEIPQEAALLSMVREARAGKTESLAQFIQSNLLNEQGGIQTEYRRSSAKTVPSGADVLSESQGLMLQYAQKAGKQDLFDRLWSYVKNNMTAGGLPAWVTQEGASPSTVTAAVDDLRIYRVLSQSRMNAAVLKPYADALLQYETENQNLVDFYDFSWNQKASRFTLCYADFQALSLLKQQDSRFGKVYDNSLRLVQKGKISQEFPLYYSYYDFSTGQYRGESLHMSEALLTLLHLSQANRLPAEAMDWVEERMREGFLYAKYDLDGRVSEDGLYESTGTYALVAQLALSENRLPVAQAAFARMETLRVRDKENPVDGAFGNADGTGIYSFDQCMALLAYQQMEQRME
ncbi:redoxin domain-containing protein [Clostridium minihomine]|uniref:redoxin domain-containing protein n=1 Tax=Clostridium minihomine TaxID=2045012 RepID=UPI000C764D91|nr:redoxin domain-containing protein [Clostridium minihomine]